MSRQGIKVGHNRVVLSSKGYFEVYDSTGKELLATHDLPKEAYDPKYYAKYEEFRINPKVQKLVRSYLKKHPSITKAAKQSRSLLEW